MLGMINRIQFAIVGLAVILFAANASAKLRITSPAFRYGGPIPTKYTCDAKNPPNPPLKFSGVPAKAKSLVLIIEDPDVPKTLIPSGFFDHWMVWNIPASSKGIKEGDSAQGLNGRGKAGYVGPCPPDRVHRYFFHLYALDTMLTGEKIANRDDLNEAMKSHIIEQAEWMGRYNLLKNRHRSKR
jgi:Raf kinase inhibitor-like YbhB/YbcL family protein